MQQFEKFASCCCENESVSFDKPWNKRTSDLLYKNPYFFVIPRPNLGSSLKCREIYFYYTKFILIHSLLIIHAESLIVIFFGTNVVNPVNWSNCGKCTNTLTLLARRHGSDMRILSVKHCTTWIVVIVLFLMSFCKRSDPIIQIGMTHYRFFSSIISLSNSCKWCVLVQTFPSQIWVLWTLAKLIPHPHPLDCGYSVLLACLPQIFKLGISDTDQSRRSAVFEQKQTHNYGSCKLVMQLWFPLCVCLHVDFCPLPVGFQQL